MKKEEYLQIAQEKFGDDPNDYVFECPICHYCQSRKEIMKLAIEGKFKSKRYGSPSYDELRKLGPSIEQECLSPDCNYVSYGLIQAGVTVDGGNYFPLKGMKERD